MKKQFVGVVLAALLMVAPAAALTRVETHGGWYGERGTDGRRAVIVDGAYIQTHLGRVELPRFGGLPDLPLHLRTTPVGEFKMCGQSHRGAGTWEWAHGEWHVAGPSYGVNACIYDYAGRLHIGALPFGSQGFRWVMPDHSLVLGDLTYADPSRRIWEFTEQMTAGGKLTIGQGEAGCIALRGDARVMLEPGHCTVARFTHANGVSAVYMVKLLERKSVELVFADAELASFPPEPVITTPEEICGNDEDDDRDGLVDEPPCPVDPIDPQLGRLPDAIFATLTAERAKFPTDRDLTADEICAVLNATAWAHRTGGAGLQRKDGGTNCLQPRTGIPVWRGFRVGNVGYDVCGACTVFVFTPIQADGGAADAASFVDPVEPTGPGPDPDPDQGTIDALQKRVAELEEQLRGWVATHAQDVGQIATLDQQLTAAREEISRLNAEIERLRNLPAPTCRVTGPGWVRQAFGIRCEIVR